MSYNQYFVSEDGRGNLGYVSYTAAPALSGCVAAGERMTISGSTAVYGVGFSPLWIGVYAGNALLAGKAVTIHVNATPFSLSFALPVLTDTRAASYPLTFRVGNASTLAACTQTATTTAIDDVDAQKLKFLHHRLGVRFPVMSLRRAVMADGAYAARDDGLRALVRLRATLGTGASQSEISVCKLQFGVCGGTLVTVSISKATLFSAGGYDESAPGLLSGEYAAADMYELRVTVGDAYDSYTARAILPAAFANFHLSGCASGGAAFGKFSASAPGSPLLESAYPFRPLGGIEACAGVSGVSAPGYAQSAGTTYFATSGSSANALQLRRYGNLCMLSGKITPTQAIAGSAACYPICQLPAGATPPQNLYILQQGGAEHVWLLTLFTSGSGATDANGVSLAGRAAMSRYRDGGSYISCAVDRELFVCAMWIV